MSFEENYLSASEKGDILVLLDTLDNSLPFDSKDGRMEVCGLNKTTGQGTKWRSWLEVREWKNPPGKMNNRLIALPEIVFDYDPEPDETPEEFKDRILATIHQIQEDGANILGIYHTGSRGVHVHVLLKELATRPKNSIRDIKHFLLSKYGADTTKASTRCMIAIEGSKHWKTGNTKRKVSVKELESLEVKV